MLIEYKKTNGDYMHCGGLFSEECEQYVLLNSLQKSTLLQADTHATPTSDGFSMHFPCG